MAMAVCQWQCGHSGVAMVVSMARGYGDGDVLMAVAVDTLLQWLVPSRGPRFVPVSLQLAKPRASSVWRWRCGSGRGDYGGAMAVWQWPWLSR